MLFVLAVDVLLLSSGVVLPVGGGRDGNGVWFGSSGCATDREDGPGEQPAGHRGDVDA